LPHIWPTLENINDSIIFKTLNSYHPIFHEKIKLFLGEKLRMSTKLAICQQFQLGATVLGVNIVNFWKVCKMGQEELYLYTYALWQEQVAQRSQE
jgi:hypothetical protein